MLLHTLIHPPLLRALAAAGHGSKVLLADANYPVSTAANTAAQVVHLNLEPGVVDAATVLRALLTAIPVEAAAVMAPVGDDPSVFRDFGQLLPGITLERLQRTDFYDAVRSSDTALVVATGEVRHFGNLLLTVGVVPMPSTA